MKKRTAIITALLALCMIFAFAGCGESGSSSGSGDTAETTAPEKKAEDSVCTYECPGAGFGFDLPEGVEITKGWVHMYDMGDADYNSGVMMGWPVYYDMTEEEVNKLTNENFNQVNAGFSFHIVCVKDVKDADEAREKVISVMKKVEGDDYSEKEGDLYRALKEIHKQDGYMWLADIPTKKSEGIREECQAEYDAFYDATDEILKSCMEYYEPQVWQGGEEGAEVSFETTDLEGNPVKSADLFAQNKVTMINIWGTTCGPCIEEMPELDKMNKEFSEKGGAIVGLVSDVPLDNSKYLQEAKEIVKDTGATYLNLRTWDGWDDVMSAVGTPTTYFVDSNGKLIGDPILGAHTKEYKERMEECLSKAK